MLVYNYVVEPYRSRAYWCILRHCLLRFKYWLTQVGVVRESPWCLLLHVTFTCYDLYCVFSGENRPWRLEDTVTVDWMLMVLMWGKFDRLVMLISVVTWIYLEVDTWVRSWEYFEKPQSLWSILNPYIHHHTWVVIHGVFDIFYWSLWESFILVNNLFQKTSSNICNYNSLRPSNTLVMKPSLFWVMACHLTSTKPLSEPMLEYC